MRKGLWGSIVLCCLLSCLCGCQLAKEDKMAATEAQDMLIGVYITTEPLNEADSVKYTKEDIKEPSEEMNIELPKADKRVYAAKRPVEDDPVIKEEYEFEGIEGIPFFNATYSNELDADDGECHISTNDYIFDTAESVVDAGFLLEGTLCYDEGKSLTIYCNQVFQTESGEVYMVPSEGYAMCDDSFSLFFKSTYTKQLDGKASKQENKVTLHFQDIGKDNIMTVKQYNSKDQVIAYNKVKQGDSIKSIPKKSDMEYYMIENAATYKDGECKVTRKLFDKEEETLRFFSLDERGLARYSLIDLTE